MQKLIGMIALALVVCGCGTKIYDATLTPTVMANPPQGPAVKIVSVEDTRVVKAGPSDLAPTLGDLAGVNNPAVTRRAIGHWRDGDRVVSVAMLPEGQSAASVFRDVVTDAMRRSGYRVLAEGDAGYADAGPVTVKVRQFWMTGSVNIWNTSLLTVAEVEVTAPLKGFENGAVVKADLNKHTDRTIRVFDDMSRAIIDIFKTEFQAKQAKH